MLVRCVSVLVQLCVDAGKVRNSSPALLTSYQLTPTNPLCSPHTGVDHMRGARMERESIATSESWPNYNTHLTVEPSAASWPLPFPHSVTSCLLELYHECMDNNGWVWVLYEAHGRVENLSFT